MPSHPLDVREGVFAHALAQVPQDKQVNALQVPRQSKTRIPLGEGTYGKVHATRLGGMAALANEDEFVAIKVFLEEADGASGQGIPQMQLREIAALCSIPQHPHIIPLRGLILLGAGISQHASVQAVMPLVKGDLAAFCHAGALGELRGDLLSFDEGWSVCVVLASAGYPETSRSGDRIDGLDVADGCRVYHAGTRLNADGQWETAGGRVLAVVCGDETREKAVKAAHLAADGIRFDGLQRRRDIGILHFGSEIP